jgi:C-terminal processing protease CtpA/Prc
MLSDWLRKIRNIVKDRLFLSLLLSLVLHANVYMLMDYTAKNKDIKKYDDNSKKESVSVDIIVPKNSSDKGNNKKKAEIILSKTTTKSHKTKQKFKDGFWGIGVEIWNFEKKPVMYNGKIIYGEEITQVFDDYPAARVGLKSGDVILLVDGEDANINQVKGDGPKIMILTICRNGKIFNIQIERELIKVLDNP